MASGQGSKTSIKGSRWPGPAVRDILETSLRFLGMPGQPRSLGQAESTWQLASQQVLWNLPTALSVQCSPVTAGAWGGEGVGELDQPGAGGWFWLVQQQGEPQEEDSKNTAGGCERTAGKSWPAQALSPRNNTGGLAVPEAALTRQWPQIRCCSVVKGDPTAPSSVQSPLGTAGGSHVRTTIFAKLTPCSALLRVVSLAKPLCREQAQKASV